MNINMIITIVIITIVVIIIISSSSRILDFLRASRADVVCLQEVQFERSGGTFVLPAWLALEGYAARLLYTYM